MDRATTTGESDTVQFAKKEVGLTKTILLLVNNRFVRASARLEVVEGHVSELEQNGSTNNRVSPLSSIPRFCVLSEVRKSPTGNRVGSVFSCAIAASRTRLWLLSGLGCRGAHCGRPIRRSRSA